MGQYNLSEIDLQEGEHRIRLRRGARAFPEAVPVAAPAPASGGVPAPAHPQEASKPAPAVQAAPAKKLLEIKAPTVGTFYAQKEPGSPAFVSVGSRIAPTTVVCLIEAMKVYNDVTADCNGVIAEILVHDKEFVEYGTVLFRVDPTG
jgi:acetyl-CoA carboxylase biotin carboxyl carrier protein